MKNIKKITAAVLTFLIVVLSFSNMTFANANMNFDVMFVVDASGSMLQSDPQNLRMTAGRLFTDLAASDTSRAGFVQFTNGIINSTELTDLSTEKEKEFFRNTLSGLAPAPADWDDTDIALGLERGLYFLKEGNAFAADRKPVIILLSDGNTDLPYGPRTVEESEAQLVSVLEEAASLNVPIYSLGLNYGDTREIEKMQKNLQNIADQTNGKFYNVTSAQDFSKCMTQIFDDLSDGGFANLNPSYADGRFSAPFVIDNSSVLSANIVILTDKGVSDPKLYRPADGGGQEEVPLNAENNVIVTTDVDANNSSYMVLKVMYPKQGTWNVSVAGAAEDAIEIKLLTTYDLAFSLEAQPAVIGEKVTITGSLFRGDQQIQDADLLEGSQAVCTIVDNQGNIVEENVPMIYDGAASTYTYETSFEKSGNYYITANLKGKDDSFKKDSTQFKLFVDRIPISVTGNVHETLWCNPIKMDGSFNLKEVVSYEAMDTLSCQVKEGGELVDITYEENTGEVHLTPLHIGNEEIILYLSDEYGQTAEVSVYVKINPVWPVIIILIVLMVVLATAIILIAKAAKPKLVEPITIELGMPVQLRNLTPGVTTLTMPAKKAEVNLLNLIQKDQFAQSVLLNPIMQAGLIPIMGSMKLTAGKKEKVLVKLMPKIPGIVQIDNQSISLAKGYTKELRRNEKLNIQYSPDGKMVSTIILSLGTELAGFQGMGGFGTDAPFGNGNPFGEDPFSTPFYGSPFGGNDFGKINENGGFGETPSGGFGDGFGQAPGSGFGTGFGEVPSSGFGNAFGEPETPKQGTVEKPSQNKFDFGGGTGSAENSGFGGF